MFIKVESLFAIEIGGKGPYVIDADVSLLPSEGLSGQGQSQGCAGPGLPGLTAIPIPTSGRGQTLNDLYSHELSTDLVPSERSWAFHSTTDNPFFPFCNKHYRFAKSLCTAHVCHVTYIFFKQYLLRRILAPFLLIEKYRV